MKCSKCSKKAVISHPRYCKDHFTVYFEDKVFGTIKRYNLFNRDDSVCIAASGGKDSTTVLYLTKRFLKDRTKDQKLTALIIDEGIKGYREKTLKDLKRFCTRYNIPLKIISFKDEFGKTLDKMIKSKKINQKSCTICGILRRYLLNRHSKGFDCLVTGHNLDDEAQAIVMNLFRQQIDILPRLGPITGTTKHKKFVQRVKPLYFCTEKEVALYAILKGFDVSFTECPYILDAYRADVRNFLNDYEQRHRGAKLNIINSFLKILPRLKRQASGSAGLCDSCGEPSSSNMCNTCRLVRRL